METKWILLPLVGIIIIVWGLWYFVYPIFRVVEVNDVLPISIHGIEKVETEESGEKEILYSDTPASVVEKSTPPAERMREPRTTRQKNVQASTVPEIYTQDIVDITSSAIVKASGGHRASGVVKILNIGSERYIRYEDFSTIDGPGLYVYLSKDLRAKDFVNLGYRKGTKGNINYKIPAGVDLDEYKYVLHWCKPFGVLFNYADLSSISQ